MSVGHNRERSTIFVSFWMAHILSLILLLVLMASLHLWVTTWSPVHLSQLPTGETLEAQAHLPYFPHQSHIRAAGQAPWAPLKEDARVQVSILHFSRNICWNWIVGRKTETFYIIKVWQSSQARMSTSISLPSNLFPFWCVIIKLFRIQSPSYQNWAMEWEKHLPFCKITLQLALPIQGRPEQGTESTKCSRGAQQWTGNPSRKAHMCSRPVTP